MIVFLIRSPIERFGLGVLCLLAGAIPTIA